MNPSPSRFLLGISPWRSVVCGVLAFAWLCRARRWKPRGRTPRCPGLSMELEPGYGRRNRFDRVGRRKRIESDRDSTAANDRACLTLSEPAPPP